MTKEQIPKPADCVTIEECEYWSAWWLKTVTPEYSIRYQDRADEIWKFQKTFMSGNNFAKEINDKRTSPDIRQQA